MDNNFEEKMKRMSSTPIVDNADKGEEKAVKASDAKEPAEKQEKSDKGDDSPSVQKRINKLVAEKKAAKEEHDKLRAEYDDYKQKSAVKVSEPPMKGEPKFTDFKTIDDFTSAFKKFHTQEATKQIEGKMRIEAKDKEIKTKYSKMIDMGKKEVNTHGLEPDEYEDRVRSVEGKLKMHRSAQNELLDSEYGHLISLDIADDPESFNKLVDEDPSGAKQIKWLAKREAYHEAKHSKVDDVKEPVRKTTKASAPDSRLATGLGMNDDGALTGKDGRVNMANIKKAMSKKR